MHSRAHGKSGSTKPLSRTPPGWIGYKPEEIEFLILKLAGQGLSTSQIGLALRDSYGIPNVIVVTKKSITQILEEKKLAPKLPEDIQNLIKRSVVIRKHLEQHRHDAHSKRGLQLTESKIRRLVKYYKRRGKLPADWSYSAKEAKLIG